MNCDPNWTTYISALSVPLVALIAVYIACRQWLTAQNRLKLDLFEKRLAIYQSCTAYLNYVLSMSSGENSEKVFRNFLSGKRESKWLLSPEIAEYLNKELYFKIVDLQSLEGEVKEMLYGKVKSQKIQEQAEIKKWLIKQFQVIDEKFDEYLIIKH